MFFKKKIAAEEFGESLVGTFQHWANTALNKLVKYCQNEVNGFDLSKIRREDCNNFGNLWQFSFGEMLPLILEGDTSGRIVNSYLEASKKLINDNAFMKSNTVKLSSILSSAKNNIDGNEMLRLTELLLPEILRCSFHDYEYIMDNADQISANMSLDYGACYRELMHHLSEYKII